METVEPRMQFPSPMLGLQVDRPSSTISAKDATRSRISQPHNHLAIVVIPADNDIVEHTVKLLPSRKHGVRRTPAVAMLQDILGVRRKIAAFDVSWNDIIVAQPDCRLPLAADARTDSRARRGAASALSLLQVVDAIVQTVQGHDSRATYVADDVVLGSLVLAV